jgi:CheY-like chemotaxis protein
MDREAAEFAARIEAERIASEAPTLQPPYAADELRLQDESTAAITALHPPTLTDVMAEVLPDAIPEVAAGLVDGDGPPSTVPADDGAAARREAAARLARERAEREAAEAEAWLDEQRRADETRRAQGETDASALAETPPDIDAFTAQLEVPPRQTEEERYAEVERQTSDLVARVNAQRLAVDVLGVVPSLGIELEFPAVPGLEGLEAAAASSRITTPADALSTDDFPRVELDFAAPTLDGNEFADPEVSPTPDPIAEALAFDAKPAASAAAAPTELPLAASADNPPPVEQASPRRTTDQFVVMVADDSKVVRVKTSRLLLKQGYQVLLAEDGLDAMRQIALRVPDVLITDVEMPGLDGFGLTRQVRADVRSAHIPIVMITADDDKHRVAATGAGVSVLLSKPYPEDHLLAWLEEALGCTVAVMG